MRTTPGAVPAGLAGIFLMLWPRPAAGEQWKECREGFRHEGDKFSCFVRPDGTVRDVSIPEGLVVQEAFIHGKYTPLGEAHDSRFFQSQSKESGPLTVMDRGRGVSMVKKDGTLYNKKYDRAARYAERLTLSRSSIEFEYELELLVELASNSTMFFVIHTVPSETLANRGFRQVTSGGSKKLQVFPEKYEKESAVRAHGLKELSVVLDRHYFSFLAGDGTSMNLSDTRSWGGKGYRLDVGPATPWRPKPVTYPAGTKFKWSFRLLFFDRD